MSDAKLTASCGDVTNPRMDFRGTVGMAKVRAGWALAPIALLGGCINLAAPDKPIVIELNINIRQEVIYMLAEDSAETIEEMLL